MKCFVCKKNYNFKALMIHLKVFHAKQKDSEFQCYEDNCFQYFSNLDSFRKHMKKHETKLIGTEKMFRDSTLTQAKPSIVPIFPNPINNMYEPPSKDMLSDSPKKARLTNKSDLKQFTKKLQNSLLHYKISTILTGKMFLLFKTWLKII